MNFTYELYELRERVKIIEAFKRGDITEEDALREINRRAKLWAKGERVIE